MIDEKTFRENLKKLFMKDAAHGGVARAVEDDSAKIDNIMYTIAKFYFKTITELTECDTTNNRLRLEIDAKKSSIIEKFTNEMETLKKENEDLKSKFQFVRELFGGN